MIFHKKIKIHPQIAGYSLFIQLWKWRFSGIVWFVLLLFFACQPESSSEETARIKNTYLAHSFLPEDSAAAIVATVLADSLDVPWELSRGPDGWLWFTEQKGFVKKLHPETAEQKVLLELKDLVYQKSRGLYGMAFHPDFRSNPYVYLAYTYYQPDTSTSLRVVRYSYQEGTLADPFVLLEDIPGETYHNGSRLMISQDHKLFITTGDAGSLENPQNPKSLSGKVLRLNLDGSIPEDNPFKGNPVWTSGHRNAQGLTQAENGNIYISEHGPDNDDEVNLILKGRNYGWPDVMGYCDLPSEKKYCADSNIAEPLMAWSPVIAPAGMEYYAHSAIPEWGNSLIMGSLKNQTLRVLHLNEEGTEIEYAEEWFPKTFGRIRDVSVSPEGDVYISTSNKDWHPRHFSAVYQEVPGVADDRIIKLSKATPAQLAWLQSASEPVLVSRQAAETTEVPGTAVVSGEALYQQYCSGCHLAEGQGVEGLYPPLAGSEWVVGDKERLIQVVLEGLSGPIEVKGKTYNQQMPAYRFLSDEQVSGVLSYIRQHFGNSSAPVSAEEIAAERPSL